MNEIPDIPPYIENESDIYEEIPEQEDYPYE
jgi:hypothetical protein